MVCYFCINFTAQDIAINKELVDTFGLTKDLDNGVVRLLMETFGGSECALGRAAEKLWSIFDTQGTDGHVLPCVLADGTVTYIDHTESFENF